MTAANNHFGKSDACFHLLGAVGEAHVKESSAARPDAMEPPKKMAPGKR
jgi:hypothetical protein